LRSTAPSAQTFSSGFGRDEGRVASRYALRPTGLRELGGRRAWPEARPAAKQAPTYRLSLRGVSGGEVNLPVGGSAATGRWVGGGHGRSLRTPHDAAVSPETPDGRSPNLLFARTGGIYTCQHAFDIGADRSGARLITPVKNPGVSWRLRSQALSWGKEMLRSWQPRGSTPMSYPPAPVIGWVAGSSRVRSRRRWRWYSWQRP
jgi:hypothetical protein